MSMNLVYELAKGVIADMRGRGFPVRLNYAPRLREVTRENYPSGLIEIERPRQGTGDTYGGPQGFDRNPRKIAARMMLVNVRIYAHATIDGAAPQDHENECEHLLDGFLVSLRKWTASNKTAAEITLGGFLAPDSPAVEAYPGVVYGLAFAVGRAVVERTYDGSARSTGTITNFSNQTRVKYETSAGDSEVGCGEEP